MEDRLTKRIQKYQEKTFRFLPERRVRALGDAVKFINERGFVLFWPISGKTFPSLWGAVAGNRPVPDFHHDPGHVTWDWKDKLLGKRQCYYSRVLNKRNTFISNQMLPNFYALSPNYGNYEDDYLISYQQGKMTAEARGIYEALLNEGSLDSLALRKSARLMNTESASRFNTALEWLQRNFMIMPTGISEVGRWNYAFNYDITARYLPDLLDQTRFIDDDTARQTILTSYIESTGYATQRELKSMLGWDDEALVKSLDSLPAANDNIIKVAKETAGFDGWLLKKLNK